MKTGLSIAAAFTTSLLIIGTSSAALAKGAIRIDQTSTEYRSNPLALETATPRLSWVLGAENRNQWQTAYQVRVASTIDGLRDPDIWDSGRIASHQSALVPYGGSPLQSRKRYYWSVRVWDANGEPSEWSSAAWWEMGLLTQDNWHAQWIGHDQKLPLPTVFNRYNDPSQLRQSETQGQTFLTDKTFTSIAVPAPTFVTQGAGMTLSLYQEGPGGKLMARQRFDNHPDNGWATLRLRTPAPPGKYYVEQSEATGRIGWWTNQQGGYDHGEAFLNGKPVAGDRGLRWEPTEEVVHEGLSPQLRKEFSLPSKIVSARLYATALGLHQIDINGRRVGNDVLAPGWTDYQKRVQYQTYDVTQLLLLGKNAITATISPGWYSGNIATFGTAQYGKRPYVMMQLEIQYANGTTGRVITDGSWRTQAGPVVQADLLMGERYDARLESADWNKPGFDDARWKPALVNLDVKANLVTQPDAPVRITSELRPIKITQTGPRTFLYDLGQNIVGMVRLRISGKPGQVITLRHAEVLDGTGTIYTDNLRTARAVDIFTLKGGAPEMFQPAFTFHGFRYVEVSGADAQPEVTGLAINSAAPLTMAFETDVPMINQLQRNIVWSQRGNFVSVPTDTPARDERLGWTGDIAAFVGAATYNMAAAGFLSKWLTDLRDTQSAEGAYADVAPTLQGIGAANAGWGDAGVIVPWTLYERYGDREVLAQNFPAMSKWVDYLKRNSKGYLRPDAGYGDWLNVDDETPKDLIATAFFAHSAQLTARAARVLGKDKDASQYESLFRSIQRAFQKAYLRSDGSLMGGSQTAYVLALSMDLLPANQRTRATNHLVGLIEKRNWHLSTGFLGTPRLLSALSENGRVDVAYRLLLQTTFPSWGYQIGNGATTMWERWDAIRPDGSFQDKGMNSFNHYAYGAVGEWMYQNIAGIRPASPGFNKVLIKPQPGHGIGETRARYQSVHGPIEVRWIQRDGKLEIEVGIPVNCSAEIWVPATGQQRTTADGAKLLYRKAGHAVFHAGSGNYRFTVQ